MKISKWFTNKRRLGLMILFSTCGAIFVSAAIGNEAWINDEVNFQPSGQTYNIYRKTVIGLWTVTTEATKLTTNPISEKLKNREFDDSCGTVTIVDFDINGFATIANIKYDKCSYFNAARVFSCIVLILAVMTWFIQILFAFAKSGSRFWLGNACSFVCGLMTCIFITIWKDDNSNREFDASFVLFNFGFVCNALAGIFAFYAISPRDPSQLEPYSRDIAIGYHNRD